MFSILLKKLMVLIKWKCNVPCDIGQPYFHMFPSGFLGGLAFGGHLFNLVISHLPLKFIGETYQNMVCACGFLGDFGFISHLRSNDGPLSFNCAEIDLESYIFHFLYWLISIDVNL